jgi:YdjC-like protein
MASRFRQRSGSYLTLASFSDPPADAPAHRTTDRERRRLGRRELRHGRDPHLLRVGCGHEHHGDGPHGRLAAGVRGCASPCGPRGAAPQPHAAIRRAGDAGAGARAPGAGGRAARRTRAHWSWLPGSERLIRRCVADQLAEFERLYGRAPTHLDGHNHVHLSPNVLLARILPRELAIRRAQNWPPRNTLTARVARTARAVWTARRPTTELFTSVRAVHPRFGGRGFDELLDRSRSLSVEIMTHPQWNDELELLTSEEWRAALRVCPLGCYEDLTSSARAPAGAG